MSSIPSPPTTRNNFPLDQWYKRLVISQGTTKLYQRHEGSDVTSLFPPPKNPFFLYPLLSKVRSPLKQTSLRLIGTLDLRPTQKSVSTVAHDRGKKERLIGTPSQLQTELELNELDIYLNLYVGVSQQRLYLLLFKYIVRTVSGTVFHFEIFVKDKNQEILRLKTYNSLQK